MNADTDEDLLALVEDASLDTEFHLPEYVLHRCYDSKSNSAEARGLFEEIWDFRERIGQGGYGDVHRQECRNPRPTAPTVRAIKIMRKVQAQDPQWSYRAELQAMIKFSQPEVRSQASTCVTRIADNKIQFDPYFVRTFGWFEDPGSIYIAMEYLPNGDLYHHAQNIPPFSELDASKIIRQLIQGVQFMHDNGFAHRDLKPQVSNICSFLRRVMLC